jgi:integration host factor subunit alpha
MTIAKKATEKKVLTKQELIQHLIQKSEYTHREAFSHVDAFIDSFVELLSDGNHLKMSYLGDFVLQDKTPRPGRNPKTGEEYEISARRVLKFHPSAKLKKTVKEL